MSDRRPAKAGELPAELVQILIELSNALARHTMYPPGHPLLPQAAENLALLLNRSFKRRTALALGISPTQIIAGGIPSDPAHPVIRDLAARLHRRNIGALKLYRGIERDELDQALRYLSEEADSDRQRSQRWPHIRLHPLSYSQLELIGDAGGPAGSSWATSLWLDLSRAALETEQSPDGTPDPAHVARAIDARQGDDSYSRKIAESLADLLDACRARGGAEAIALQSHLSRLISSMEPETLERLIMQEKNEAERKRFLLDIAQSMAVDAVLDLVQAAATATSRSLSPALLQLLGKLAEHSEQGVRATRHRAEFAFRNQVRQLVEGWEEWDAKDPAPGDHQRTLENLNLAGQSPLRGHSSTYECEPERVLMLSLEVGVSNTSTNAAATFLITQGKTPRVKELFGQTPFPGLPSDIMSGVASEKSLRSLLAQDPLDMSGVDLIVAPLGPDALLPLMDGLVEADQAERRDQLIGVLVPFGEAAGNEALNRIGDAPWPAQRNLLTLLSRLPAFPRGFSSAPWIEHPETRVRHEALRILFRGAATRSRAICEALAAGDPATVRLGVSAAAEECPLAAVPLLIPLVERGDLDPGLRSRAALAMAPVPQPLVVDCLTGLCLVRAGWFRRSRIDGKSPVVLAALSGLARHWSHHQRARSALDLALGHADPDVRAAAESKPR